MLYHKYYFFSLSGFNLGLTLMLKSKMAFKRLLCLVSALLIVILPLKILLTNDLIVETFLIIYLYLCYSSIKSFILICSSSCFMSFISFLISLLSKLIPFFVDVPLVLKLLKLELAFFLDLQLFLFIFRKLFRKENK